MRSLKHIARVALFFAACCMVGGGISIAGGKGGGGQGRGSHGGGGGHGGGGAHGFGGDKHATSARGKPDGAPRDSQLGGGRDAHGPKQGSTGSQPNVARDTHEPKATPTRDTRGERPRKHEADRVAGDEPNAGGDQPWAKQRGNEERKLEHRLDVADRLDKLADANGNEHLHETAERMRQKAHDLYEKRLSKIDSKSPPEDADDLDPAPPAVTDGRLADSARKAPGESLAKPLPKPIDDGARPKLTGRENALQRQLANEERKLQQRTELAERLRAMADEQGDAELSKAADRLEEQALSHFEQRMQAIRSFEERHGLALEE